MRLCYGGLDLSSTTDLTAFSLWWPPAPGGANQFHIVKTWHWIPQAEIENKGREHEAPYQYWIDKGFIEAIPGPRIDYDCVRARIVEIVGKCQCVALGLDRWNATRTYTQLEADGLNPVMVGMGLKSMTAPMKFMESLVVNGLLVHNKNPVLRWEAGNVVADTDWAENCKPNKKKSTGRIDGIVSMLIALSLVMAQPEYGDERMELL